MASVRTVDEGFLHRLIAAVGSSPQLDDVLAAVVRLLSDASAVHACFIYLLDEERLVLRAASAPYARFVDRIVLERGEGVAWWAAEQREPAFIRENALADPRMKYVPELEEERFQSLVCVPILAPAGSVTGVISLHTEAPREFSEAEADFLVSGASLVAGAIENARLYDELQRRVGELEQLVELGDAVARAATVGELLPAVAARARVLLAARACHVYLLDAASEELRLRASAPPGSAAAPALRLSELGRIGTVAAPLVANEELLGLLLAEASSSVELARAVASQTATALKKIELIERLTEQNLIRDFLEELASGRDAQQRAARLGCDLEHEHVVLLAAPPDERLESLLARLAPRTLVDRRDDVLRALVPVPPAGLRELVAQLRRLAGELEPAVHFGLSNPCRGAGSFASGFEEARQALVGSRALADPVTAYDELGSYKYLLRMPLDGGDRDRHRAALERLVRYDRERATSLLHTLEEFLGRRGNISATSGALHVHPNTLRQRLRRIGEISGLDLRQEDWLLVEIALKLVKLEQAQR